MLYRVLRIVSAVAFALAWDPRVNYGRILLDSAEWITHERDRACWCRDPDPEGVDSSKDTAPLSRAVCWFPDWRRLFYMIPAGFEAIGDLTIVGRLVVLGFSAFLLLEKLLHWHHLTAFLAGLGILFVAQLLYIR
jgi:hypothetical protein